MSAQALSDHLGAALSAFGIYGVLERFFATAGKLPTEAEFNPERFYKASTHWMRHTFVRQALVDGAAIEVVRELVEHASNDTTSTYSTKELTWKIKAVQGEEEGGRVVRPPWLEARGLCSYLQFPPNGFV